MRFPTLALTRSGSGSVAVPANLSAWLPKLPERRCEIRATRFVNASVNPLERMVKCASCANGSPISFPNDPDF